MRGPVLILATVILAGALSSLPRARGSEENNPTTATPRFPRPSPDVTDAQVKAVQRGLAWLAKRQHPDGSWSDDPNGSLAITSLTLLSFMANGNTESRGRYRAAVRKGLKLLLRMVTTPGAATPDTPVGFIHRKRDKLSKMHAHGYATLVLALALGMSEERDRREEIRSKLRLAVRLIENVQSRDTGGWYYDPRPDLGHEGSVTVCQIQALRMARDAGIRVNPVTIEKAYRYLEKSQDTKTGGFRYSLTEKRTSYALTAAALATLFGLGRYDEKERITAGLEYMAAQFDRVLRGREPWFYYGNFYAAQVLWQAGAAPWGRKYWKRWWPAMRDLLVDSQGPAGNWTHRGASGPEFQEVYATAFNTLVLQVPMGLLPLFQR